MRFRVRRPSSPLCGTITVPGDKSISHRAVLFAAMADGLSRLTGVLDSADVRSTIAAVEALGARVRVLDASTAALLASAGAEPSTCHRSSLSLAVTGWGEQGPASPGGDIDCGNSGTTTRLLLGVLAGWPIEARLTGDASLSGRPMRRVTGPLEAMGANFETSDGRLPITVHGGALHPIQFVSPVASAQVKSAVLLAGLEAGGRTSVKEPAASRDHTERMLPLFGVPVGRDEFANKSWVTGPATLTPANIAVPADPSSAAFVVAAALVVPGSGVRIPGVCTNPGRNGFLRVLERMGAHLTIAPVASDDAAPTAETPGEPVGDVSVAFSSGLVATVVTAAEVPSLIDEIPVLALIASQAKGTTRFDGVGELRVKESDRLAAIVEGLTALGVRADSGEDWLEVTGPTAIRPAVLGSRGDHRLAMTWAVAGLMCADGVQIDDFEAIDVSYPTFIEDLTALLAPSVPPVR